MDYDYGYTTAARDIGLYMNSGKTEFMYFSQDSGIPLLNNKPMEFVLVTSVVISHQLKPISTYTQVKQR